jgi:uncharacterized protein with NAD-binding domain and iron-sulfur cluster
MTTSTGTSSKTRVAILGGGPAGLTAAMSLSATAELRARYDVTIYQSGWRVGGKCGQGRKGPANRIEINGTHYLFGAYDAVFDLARDVFAELETAGDERFGTYASQFLPCSTVAVKEFFNGNWDTWVINLPGDGVPPSGPAAELTLGDTMRSVIGMIIDECTAERLADLVPATGVPPDTSPAVPDPPHWWQRVAEFIGRELHAAEHRVGIGLLHLALNLVHGLEHEAMQPTAREALVWLLSHFRSWAQALLQKSSGTRIDARRLWQLIDLGTSVLIGMIEDHVFEPGGFDGIDQYDLREWLVRSGAQESTAWSAPIVTWYNAIAAYEHGDVTKPNMSAGIGLRGLIRLGLTYRGAFSFQLSCEVGDSLVAPMYQVLKNRGVRVMYFHRVRDVVPSNDGATIESIAVERQVTLKSGDPSSYDPFMTLPNGRPVWPDAPLADQIAGPPACAADLLSFYAPDVGSMVTLTRGVDFDTVIYALPVATARWYCAGLVNQKAPWRAMVDHLGTTETQSLRMWMYPTVEEIGWPYGQSVLSGYFEPLATWEDARQLIAAETWPAAHTPGGIATLFGVLPGAPAVYPGPDDEAYPARRAAQATQTALQFCQSFVGSLWPGATGLHNPVGIDWQKLVSLDDGLRDEQRLAAQSIIANVGPVEAYTQIQKGTLQYRLRVNETGYANLLIAGDWVRNGYEVGSVEGAVLGGLQAAAAIIAAG